MKLVYKLLFLCSITCVVLILLPKKKTFAIWDHLVHNEADQSAIDAEYKQQAQREADDRRIAQEEKACREQIQRVEEMLRRHEEQRIKREERDRREFEEQKREETKRIEEKMRRDTIESDKLFD